MMDKKRIIVKKPERGSFLLDHNSECTSIKNNYLKCLKEHNNDHISCREYSKEYFICRMDRNLLEKQSLNDLGFSENEINHESRLKYFKDVYSYNTYNEKTENLSKEKLSNENNINKNETYITGIFKQNNNRKEEDVKETNEVEFLLLDSINKNISEENLNSEVSERNEEKKIAIKRKEEIGYLAGKEYIKVLLDKKKKKDLLFRK
ncbi:cytochrome c oxidase assembly protein COX19 [Plasmodium brasilianum]|uniref:Cytochrome c oxidase assembly protein COX19, putative n=2 Tax=Plasmodium (Plasmodium) TaxID=418103 RepID=A0A1A8W8D9_PLAMA|nr:cytochrome c oxidase assembly protein COX19, putative [Plasmodium malariae]KAI4835552.1 cytochrome c oxidase assembly protein COX19 [Plasmodium brasilianum]SBS89088.1 cytochrome c oxidase assembly protein COX19, putative (COX19) [Plasmodium malariae]SCP02474.1 cytochrome c oxidase assembly protein COX19, putative [Plasmodium malariae]